MQQQIDQKTSMMQMAPYSDGLYHQPVIFLSEQFLPVPGFDNRYYISSLGRLYDDKYGWHCKPSIRRNSKTGKPTYIVYHLQYGANNFYREFAQRLMMITFKPEENMENKVVVFLDHNPLNLVLKNMVWMTYSEKNKFLAEEGIFLSGEKSKSIYSENQIKRVCMLLEKGFTPDQIKEIMPDLPKDGNTSFNTICSRLRTGRSWKYVKKDYDFTTTRNRIDPELIHAVCKLLEQNKNSKEIATELDIKYKDYETIRGLCTNLRARAPIYNTYTNQYPNIPYTNKNILTDEEIEMAIQLKSQGYLASEIVRIMQKNDNNITEFKIYELFRRIRKNPNCRGADVARRYGII